jgi:hypothetical protein
MCFDQILNRANGLGIIIGEQFLPLSLPAAVEAGAQQRLAGDKMLHDGAENHRLEIRPLPARFRDRDEVRAEKHAADAVDRKQRLCERRLLSARGAPTVERAFPS